MDRITRRLILVVATAATLAIAATAPVAADQSGLAGLRNATAPFHSLAAAKAAGYTVKVADLAGITCIADPNGAGTMGIHYLNPSLLDDAVHATTPELVIYAPGRDGRLQLVAVEYLVLQADWDASHASPPSLFGEQFHLTPAGNRYGLPAFYELHAWVWQPNPSGMFFEWNPRISC
jgi:hypothetical protein